ncbi:MAG: YebC/PmpR family DNA-binding transcriptional regulator [Verrucomicrobiia bacterium]
MAGHNKWSKIKRTKSVLDAKRGKIFSKLSKEITVATKLGGPDPNSNTRLRSAILAAKAENMPGDNVERAIKKGTGELQGEAIEEIVYEGYAPGGVAVMIEAATDNRNRAAADLRAIFSKHHGSLATTGSVSYMFHRKGRIAVSLDRISEDALLEMLLDAEVDELMIEEEHHVILTPPAALYQVAEILKAQSIEPDSVALIYHPETHVSVTDAQVAAQILRLLEALEDDDDVQNVYSNVDLSDDLLASAVS